MLIKGYNLNNELIVEIGKFSILWNLFEANYFGYKCTPKSIMEKYDCIPVSSEKQQPLAKALNDRREDLRQRYHEFIENGLYSDDRSPRRDEIRYIEAFLKQEGDTICGCLLCVSRIRNNMMHGLKDVEKLNDQLEIFKAANGVLESL